MAQKTYAPSTIAAGERYFALYVDCTNSGQGQIVGELEVDLIGPVTPEVTGPRKVSGHALPALEALWKANQLAENLGVRQIFIVDPYDWLSHAKINRYAL